MDCWRLLPFSYLSAAENMATDEAVFIYSQTRQISPTIRFYSWLAPAISIGIFQQVNRDIDLAACRKMSLDIVRRPTGGKAVFHQHDLTYAVVGFEQHDGFPSDILGTYRIISQCLIRGLRNLGIETEMSGEIRKIENQPAEALCFSSPTRYELLVKGRKICGSAQVRSRGTFLQHGSVLLDFDPVLANAILLSHRDKENRQTDPLRKFVTSLYDEGITLPDMETLCNVLKTGFETILNIRLKEGVLTEEEESLKKRLLENKYGSDYWNIDGKADMQKSDCGQ